MKEIILNHKMNLDRQEIKSYIEEWKKIDTNYHIVICPSFPYLPYFEETSYDLGSQDVSAFPSGSHTGEVSARQLKSLNVKYTIVGHSERRETYPEEKNLIKEKLARLKEVEITPILCIGEKEDEDYQKVLIDQLKELNLDNVIVAYEPLYAIGTGKTPSKERIEEVITFLKEQIGNETKVLYGGSVTEENAKYLLESKVIDGLLIGKSSLSVSLVKKIIE